MYIVCCNTFHIRLTWFFEFYLFSSVVVLVNSENTKNYQLAQFLCRCIISVGLFMSVLVAAVYFCKVLQKCSI